MNRLAFLRLCVLAACVVLTLSILSVVGSAAANLGWEGPVLISRDDLLEVDPAVAVDASGNAVAVWTRFDGDRWSVWENRFWPGDGWGVAEEIGGGLRGFVDNWSRAHVAVNPQGTAIAVWSGNGSVWATYLDRLSRTPGYDWAAPLPIRGQGGVAGDPEIAVGPYGRVLVAWTEANETGNSLWTSWYAPQEGWRELTRMDDRAWPLRSELPQVAASQTGNAVVIWSETVAVETGGTLVSELMANSYVSGLGWGSPIRIDVEGCPIHARLALSPAGRGLVVWQEAGGCSGSGQNVPIWARSFTADGRWGAALKGPEAWNGVDVAVNETGAATVVWRGGPDIAHRIWTAPFAPAVGWGNQTFVAEATFCCAWPEDVPPRIAIDGTGLALVVFYTQYNGSNNDAQLRLAASWSTSGVGWSEPVMISAGRRAFSDEVGIGPPGTAVVVWMELESTGVNEWRGGIWANGYPISGSEQRLRDLKNSLDLTNTILAQLSAQVLRMLIVFVTTVAALVILLSLSLRRRGFAVGPVIRRRGARSEGPLSPPSQPSSDVELAERPALSQLSPTNSSPHRQAKRGSVPIASIRLTAKERVLLHLLRYPRYADELEVPPDLTQEGIATAAWIDHRHFAQYAGPLVRDGLVRERTAHVRNGHQRRRVYDLTEIGRRVALRLLARAKSEIVRVWDGEHIWDVQVGDILQKLDGKATVLDIARHLTEAGVVDFATLGTDWEDSSIRAEESNAKDGVHESRRGQV